MKTIAISGLGCLASLVSGCSFLLDFETLQDEARVEAPDGGGGFPMDDDIPVDDVPNDDIAAGGSNSGGCSESCDDGDACTTDRCVDSQCVSEPKLCTASDVCMVAACVDGQCQESAISGIVTDGPDAVLDAEQIFRSDLTSAGDRFFSAAYGTFSGTKDIVLRAHGTSGNPVANETTFRKSVDGAGIEIGSPASLLPDTRLGLRLNAYAAVKTDLTFYGQLVRLQFDRNLNVLSDFEPAISDQANYQFVSDRLGPAGGLLTTGETFVVWAGGAAPSPGIYLQTGDQIQQSSVGPMFPTAVNNIRGLASISGPTLPGAVWMSDGATGLRLQVGIQGNNPTSVVQCDSTAGYSGYLLDVDRSISNVWTVAWTKKQGDLFVSELSALSCNDGGCIDLTTLGANRTCAQSQIEGRVFPGFHSISTRTMRRQGDPDNVIYQAVLLAANDGTDSSVTLLVNRVEFDLANDTQEKPVPVGEPITFAKQPAAQGPRDPKVALLPPNRLAVSWIAPKAGGGEELHVQRHRICFDP